MLKVRDDRPLGGIHLDILRHLNATFYLGANPKVYLDSFEKGLFP
jgi:hypothetical protein